MGLRGFFVLASAALAVLVVAQSGPRAAPPGHLSAQEPVIKTAQQNRFKSNSMLPDCYTYTTERGDPRNGPSVTLSKLASRCKVPWHTHSANAQVLFVKGAFELNMKGQEAEVLRSGSYAYVPADHQHQETCLEDCMYYVIREAAADVHYLDGQGKEISPRAALAAVGERPGAD